LDSDEKLATPKVELTDAPEVVSPPVNPPPKTNDDITGEMEDVVADPEGADLRARISRIEANILLEALRAAEWNQREAARRLGLPLRTLQHKIKGHGIRRLGYGMSEPAKK